MEEGKFMGGGDKSMLDRAWEWFEQNRHILWGGGSLFIGFYLLAKTYALFVQIAVAGVGAILILYGLSELRITSIQKLYQSIIARFSKARA
jgi:hypothetical protein